MAECMREKDGKIFLDIKAAPGSSKSALAGIQARRLKVKIASAPEDGKANAELIAFFARALGCAKKEIILSAGERSRLKTLVLPPAMKAKLCDLISTCLP